LVETAVINKADTVNEITTASKSIKRRVDSTIFIAVIKQNSGAEKQPLNRDAGVSSTQQRRNTAALRK
jgi:hypothetical protein